MLEEPETRIAVKDLTDTIGVPAKISESMPSIAARSRGRNNSRPQRTSKIKFATNILADLFDRGEGENSFFSLFLFPTPCRTP